jgi:uncharacterized protein
MNDTIEETPEKKLPFNNLYLISGLVNGFNKGWMYFFTILSLIFGYLSFQLLSIYPLSDRLKKNGYSKLEIISNQKLLYDSVALDIDRNYVFLLELGMFVFAFIAFYSAVKSIHKKTLTSLLTGYERFRYKRTLFAFLVWSVLIVLETIAEYFITPGNFEMHINYSGLFFSILIAVVLMPIQSGLEELFFRGYLIQGLSQFKLISPLRTIRDFIVQVFSQIKLISPLRKIKRLFFGQRNFKIITKIDNWIRKSTELVFRNGLIPLIITSLLFGLAHMSNPEVEEYGRPIMLFYYCSFALFMGAITLLDEGLELAIGIHIANNIVSGILVSDPHSVIKSYSIFESAETNVSLEVFIWFILAAITFAIFWLKFRWKNFKLIYK